jgi:nucleoside-diphosphate-sugar epimerase
VNIFVKETLLITGATGFIGRHLANRLTHNNYSVCAVTRSYKSTYELPGLSWVHGDLSDKDFLFSITKCISTVFHLAAVVPQTARYNNYWQINVVGTKNLLEACDYNGVEKLIYVSSVDAHASPLTAIVNESAKLGGIDSYGRSKANAEHLVENSPVATTILRPCQVYGEGDLSTFTKTLIKLLELPILPIASGKDNQFSLVHVKDLVDALVNAATQSSSTGEVYNIAGSEPTSLEEMTKIYSSISGHRQLRFHVPRSLIRFLLASRCLLGNIIRQETPYRPRTYAQDELHGSILLGGPKYDISKAQRDLGYCPKITPEAGILRLLANKSA